jgi:hypothetical protein
MKYFKDYFTEKINEVYNNLVQAGTLEPKYKINVIEELSFGTEEDSERDVINIVFKTLVGTILTNSTVQPVQFICFSEPGNTETALTILNEYAKLYNMTSFVTSFVYHKQMYSTPTIMSNFNRTPDGLRSMIFMSATLIITQNVKDVQYIKVSAPSVTETTIKFTSFALSYAATPDNQRVSGQELNQTKKKLASQVLSFTCHNQSTAIHDRFFSIANGSNSGNTVFTVKLYSYPNGETETLLATLSMIMIDYSLTATPGELPMLTMRFMK